MGSAKSGRGGGSNVGIVIVVCDIENRSIKVLNYIHLSIMIIELLDISFFPWLAKQSKFYLYTYLVYAYLLMYY